MVDEQDYYAILGITPDADEVTIRLAFRQLARRYHPDVAGTGSLARMQALNVAYATLSDPERRRLYDLQRGTAATSASATVTTTPTREAPAREASTERPAAARASRPAQPRRQRSGSISATPGLLRRLTRLEVADSTPIVALAFADAGRRAGLGLIDGRVTLWNVAESRLATTLTFGGLAGAGVLQDLRLSPRGLLASGWGFQLGMRAWQIGERRALWSAGASAPSGLMDAALLDEPPFLRLAGPDAPLVLAEEDPFRWAHEGRQGTAVYSRPLAGPVNPAWATPLRCREGNGGGLFRDGREQWRVSQRLLSRDGRFLLTFAVEQQAHPGGQSSVQLWELDHRNLRGASEARRVSRIVESNGLSRFALAATPDLTWVATARQGGVLELLEPREHQQRALDIGALPEDARAALTPDGELLALARSARLDLYETRSGRHVQEWQFATEITALAFSSHAGAPVLGVALRNGVAELWGG